MGTMYLQTVGRYLGQEIYNMNLHETVAYVLFTFVDGTHLVVQTSLNTNLVPLMEQGCVYDLIMGVNIPLEELAETEKEFYLEYPEQYREESEFYAKLRTGV